MNTRKALEKAIAIAGGQSALARAINKKRNQDKRADHPIRQSHVWTWLNRDTAPPEKYCPDIESVTNGAVRCEDLRPDVDWAVLRGTVAETAARDSGATGKLGGEAA